MGRDKVRFRAKVQQDPTFFGVRIIYTRSQTNTLSATVQFSAIFTHTRHTDFSGNSWNIQCMELCVRSFSLFLPLFPSKCYTFFRIQVMLLGAWLCKRTESFFITFFSWRFDSPGGRENGESFGHLSFFFFSILLPRRRWAKTSKRKMGKLQNQLKRKRIFFFLFQPHRSGERTPTTQIAKAGTVFKKSRINFLL